MVKGPRYRCSACSMGVIVLANTEQTTVIRGCKCENASIVADCSATVVARGGVGIRAGRAQEP